jgi:hypothetical protein
LLPARAVRAKQVGQVRVQSIEVKALLGLFSNVELKLLPVIPTGRATIGCVLDNNSREPPIRGRFLL